MLAAKCLTFGQTDSSIMAKTLQREEFPDHFFLSAIAFVTICRLGADGYRFAIDFALKKR
jgi:3-dehydroquinate dehydratase-2